MRTDVLSMIVVAGLLVLATGGDPARADRADATPAWGLADLMAAMGKVRASSARFVERKYLSVTTAPLRSSGVLRYAAPGRVEKETLLPQPRRMIIVGDTLTMERPGAPSRVVSIRDIPEIAGLIEGVRATLAGDIATLNQFYAVSFTGDVMAWQLELTPRDSRLSAIVAHIRMRGQSNALAWVETQETDGDRTELVIDADPP